ncbi:SEL1-like repeat protein [Moraxella equi]|uniref:SEL1-like repeat protein n=1 Tax=Moraxella equi TaxID=60442 RepID=UPI00142DB27B|nr:SEL1-like repeat protein [Moraxella equi]
MQANTMLFEENNPASCPAEIIYDKSGRTPPHLLQSIAQTLLSFKKQTPNDLPPKLKQYAQHLQNERTRFSGELPAPPTTAMSLYAKTIFVWRLHLPDAMLTLPIFPIIINDDNDEVMILPAVFWKDSDFYQKWLGNSSDTSQEIVPMWANLPSEKASRFWQNYDELLTLQSDVLAKLFKPNAPPHNPNDFRQPKPPETGKPNFLIRLRNDAQNQYLRWSELFDLSEIKDPEAHANLAKDKLPPSLYQALRQLDLSPFWQELKANTQFANLPNTKPLPQVLTTLEQPQLSPTQTASLVQFLLKQGDVSLSKLLENEGRTTQHPNNTTALLCLAILYLTGKHVPQSIEEGLSWLDYASKLGDSRALRWQTKLALDCPSLVPILFKDFLQKEMVDFNLVLMNEGCSPLAINEAVKAYAENPKAQKWLACRPLQTAYEQGDKVAEQLLISYLNNGTLPSQDEDKFLDVKFWVIDYLLHHKNQDYTYLISYPDADYATDEPPAWHKWAKVAGVLILMSLVKMCFFNNKDIDEPPATTLPISTQPNTAPNPTTQVIERAQGTSPSDAIAKLQSTLPKKLFTGYNEITTIRQENGVVIVSLSDKSKGVMSIQSAQALYCKDQSFELLRKSGAVVNFDISAQDGLRYKIDNVVCE